MSQQTHEALFNIGRYNLIRSKPRSIQSRLSSKFLELSILKFHSLLL